MKAVLTVAALAAASLGWAALAAAQPPNSVGHGCSSNAVGRYACTAPTAAVPAEPGHGLWCSDVLQVRADGTIGNALEEQMTQLPLALAGRYAWYAIGGGITCDDPALKGYTPTGRTVDQTGAPKDDGSAVYEEVAPPK